MRYLLGTMILFVALFSLEAQSVIQIDRDEIVSLTGRENDTTYVVNFWATWCSPCVKEIGYFEELHRMHLPEKVKVILISLDFPNQLEKRVIPFLAQKEITAQVLLMTDLDYNEWIDLVDPSWSGAIPATLIYSKKERLFLEKEVTKQELFEIVQQMIN